MDGEEDKSKNESWSGEANGVTGARLLDVNREVVEHSKRDWWKNGMGAASTQPRTRKQKNTSSLPLCPTLLGNLKQVTDVIMTFPVKGMLTGSSQIQEIYSHDLLENLRDN